MINESRSKHILELAEELLDDIELNRSSGEVLLLKATRLARYVGTSEIREWLSYELNGYNYDGLSETKEKYIGLTGRWADKEKKTGYWSSLAEIEASIEAQKIKLNRMSLPNLSGDLMKVTISDITTQMNYTTKQISIFSGIKSKVLFLLHEFVSGVYYEKTFDSLSESIFESYKNNIDMLISTNCGSVLEQIPAVIDRLSDGDPESISQSLTTCRRIIDSFADKIFPPSDQTIEIGGNTLSLKADKVQNRINAFVYQNCESTSRKKKIRQSLSNLYDRVSTGVHKDVDVQEAKSLFLETYLLVGEVLSLKSY
ncbi:hypothetical protein PDR95_25485 [Bacillus cereus]|nr:hypothetical protein [Bacillus cereus]MDA2710671.1 hypothetical protein [Bacillus cereus]